MECVYGEFILTCFKPCIIIIIITITIIIIIIIIIIIVIIRKGQVNDEHSESEIEGSRFLKALFYYALQTSCDLTTKRFLIPLSLSEITNLTLLVFFADESMDEGKDSDAETTRVTEGASEQLHESSIEMMDSAVLQSKRLNTGENYANLDSVNFTWLKNYFASS